MGGKRMDTVLAVAILIYTGVALWRISSKAGFGGCLGLAMLLPLVNLIAMGILAFAKWPVEERAERYIQERNTLLRELRELRGEEQPESE